MTDETEQELIAMVAAARSIQGAAAKAVADLTRLVADNRAVPAQIAGEGAKARQGIQEAGEQVLTRISQGAEKAIRDAAVSDVGAKIETAMAGPLKFIDRSLGKLEQSASTAELAADRWQMFTRVFRWQQLTIAILFGVVIGSVGHWYFATRGPETEAAEYLLDLKSGIDKKATSAPANPGSGSKSQKPAPSTKPKPKSRPEPAQDTSPVPETAPNPETAEPPH